MHAAFLPTMNGRLSRRRGGVTRRRRDVGRARSSARPGKVTARESVKHTTGNGAGEHRIELIHASQSASRRAMLHVPNSIRRHGGRVDEESAKLAAGAERVRAVVYDVAGPRDEVANGTHLPRRPTRSSREGARPLGRRRRPAVGAAWDVAAPSRPVMTAPPRATADPGGLEGRTRESHHGAQDACAVQRRGSAEACCPSAARLVR